MEVDSWITVTVLVNLIALIFQTGAYAAPMWMWFQNSNSYYGLGLWYSVCGVGTDAGTCTTATPDEGAWLALKILQSVGLAGVLMLTVFLIVYKFGNKGKWGSMGTINVAAFILCLLSILILLGSAIMYCAYFWGFFRLVESHDKTSLPWSWFMSVLACLILMLVSYFIRNKCRVDRHGLPMSGDDKLDFQPQVMNGQAHRYYNQTPYIDEKERYVTDRSRTPIRGYEEIDDRRNGVSRYDHQTTYINRAYTTEPETNPYSSRSLSREIRDNKDRELGHTIYTGNGFSYLKEEASRPDRDDRYARDNGYVREDRYAREDRYVRDDRYDRSRDREDRYARPAATVEYITQRAPAHDDYYDNTRSSIRPYPGASRGNPASSNVYTVYRPHQY